MCEAKLIEVGRYQIPNTINILKVNEIFLKIIIAQLFEYIFNNFFVFLKPINKIKICIFEHKIVRKYSQYNNNFQFLVRLADIKLFSCVHDIDSADGNAFRLIYPLFL